MYRIVARIIYFSPQKYLVPPRRDEDELRLRKINPAKGGVNNRHDRKRRGYRTACSAVIYWYQRTLSPDHGYFSAYFPYGFCRFYPSCSEYTRQALLRRGFFQGMMKGMWRIARCTPFHRGGFDPLS